MEIPLNFKLIYNVRSRWEFFHQAATSAETVIEFDGTYCSFLGKIFIDFSMADCDYKEHEVTGKGVGCVASRDIKKGSLVLREKPVVISPEKQDMASGIRAFTMMSIENHDAYLALYNAYG